MVHENDSAKQQESRPPELKDILNLARALNEAGARYIIIGGIAVIQQGFIRATEDIDLLLENNILNLRRVIEAVAKLPDHAALEISPEEFSEYDVIRVADEIVVDLMVKASNLDYESAKAGIISVDVDGVIIPFASANLLLEMKQGVNLSFTLAGHTAPQY